MRSIRRKIISSIVVLPMLLEIGNVYAQEKTTKKWSDSAEVSVVSTNGNSKSATTSAKNTFSYKWTKRILELAAGGLGSQSRGETTAEEYFASEKVSYSLSDRNYAFEKGRWDKNRFAGIKDRYDASIGVGREVVKKPSDTLLTEIGGGYVSEERTRGPRNDFASGRLFAKYMHTFTPTAHFSQDAEYLANFEENADYRVNTETALVSVLSSRFSLKVSYKWKHVGRPPAGFGKNDTITSIAFLANY